MKYPGSLPPLLSCMVLFFGCAQSSTSEGADSGSNAARDARSPDADRERPVPATDGGVFRARDGAPVPCSGATVVACETSCGSTGSQRCVGGTLSTCEPPMETCNGLDDDCSGIADDGLSRGCATSCGSGTETCAAGSWSACTAPAPVPETCNGLDDDCNGTPENGLSRSCSTACGSGTETCSGGAWVGCTATQPVTEACNSHDDDCDGTTDEGFRARAERTTYGALATRHGRCNGTAERDGPNCNAAIHRHCAAGGCQQSGFGPIENSGSIAWVACVIGEVRHTTYGTLASHLAACNGTTARSGRTCNAAIHRYCASQGFRSGFGPVENSGNNVSLTCVPAASSEVRRVTYGTLASHLAACNGTTARDGRTCNAAIHRYCASEGFRSGFGPIENSGSIAYVTCLRD